MKPLLRGAAALLIAIASLPAANVHAQDKQVLASERDKDSYMIGMDVAKSLAPAAEDLDLAAFERAVRNSFDGGEPLIGEKEVLATGQALMVRVAARSGRPVPGRSEEHTSELQSLMRISYAAFCVTKITVLKLTTSDRNHSR